MKQILICYCHCPSSQKVGTKLAVLADCESEMEAVADILCLYISRTLSTPNQPTSWSRALPEVPISHKNFCPYGMWEFITAFTITPTDLYHELNQSYSLTQSVPTFLTSILLLFPLSCGLFPPRSLYLPFMMHHQSNHSRFYHPNNMSTKDKAPHYKTVSRNPFTQL